MISRFIGEGQDHLAARQPAKHHHRSFFGADLEHRRVFGRDLFELMNTRRKSLPKARLPAHFPGLQLPMFILFLGNAAMQGAGDAGRR